MPPTIEFDIRVENHGSIFLVRPLNELAEDWLKEHTGPETQRLGKAVAVEGRYIEDFVKGMQEDGLTVG